MESRQKEVFLLCPNPDCEAYDQDVSYKVRNSNECPECGAVGLRRFERLVEKKQEPELELKICTMCWHIFDQEVLDQRQGDSVFDFLKCPDCERFKLEELREVDFDAYQR